MATLWDYLYWRGDLTFEQSKFNEVDGVILSRLAYTPYEKVMEHLPPSYHNIGRTCEAMLSLPDIKDLVVLSDDVRLLKEMKNAARYKDLKVLYCESRLDDESQTQFFGVTYKLAEDLYYVVYRGTDSTLVGWKENFNMGFVCPVPAQKLADEYLERVASELEGSLIVGGHSKGGNLAVYAASFCNEDVQDRIIRVYNFDGPGFSGGVLSTPEHERVCERVRTYVPQSSVVGMLLGHEEKYIIVHSTHAIMLLQHDTYTWSVNRDRFRYMETVTGSSKFLDSTLKGWIADLDDERREKFVEAIFTVLRETNAKTLKDLTENWYSTTKAIVKSIKSLDSETRKIVTETLLSLVKCATNTLNSGNK
jgi:hypothetical protein